MMDIFLPTPQKRCRTVDQLTTIFETCSVPWCTNLWLFGALWEIPFSVSWFPIHGRIIFGGVGKMRAYVPKKGPLEQGGKVNSIGSNSLTPTPKSIGLWSVSLQKNPNLDKFWGVNAPFSAPKHEIVHKILYLPWISLILYSLMFWKSKKPKPLKIV